MGAIRLDCIQGLQAWRDCRIGLPTASTLHRILTPKKLAVSSAGIRSVSAEIVAERALMAPLDVDLGGFAGRGTELEPEAVAWYEVQADTSVTREGFYFDAERMTGASPDGVTPEAGIEIKCLSPAKHIRFLAGGDPTDYMAQVQACMLLCERERWDLLFYHPSLPSRIIQVVRDDEYIDALADALDQLRAAADELMRKAETAGVDFAPWRAHIETMGRGELPVSAPVRCDIWG